MHDSSLFADTPEPPYYAVIFASLQTNADPAYDRMAQRMVELVGSQPGFLGIEHARGGDGFGLTVSYWTDESSIAAWKANAEHLTAQELGRRDWYADFHLRVARVERAYSKCESVPG